MPANVGSQIVTVFFHTVANSGEWNKRNLNVRETGIYTGGWLSIVNATTAQLSALSCEIADGTYQVKVSTATTVNITISAAAPYVVLRWTYVGSVADYMEVLAVSTPAVNDLVVGMCTFTGGGSLNGFTYNTRSNPSTKDLFLKVESTGETELRVRIRSGYYQTPSGAVKIPDQKSDVFTLPLVNSQIYLVYIDTDGTVKVDNSGTPAAIPVAPSYGNKLVIAEVILTSTDTSISASKITDVRPFITRTVPGVDGTTITTDASGNLKKVDPIYLVIRTTGGQLSNLGTWTAVTAPGAIKQSGITWGILGNIWLPASRLIKISYSVVFERQNSFPVFQSRLHVISGDTSWWFADDVANVSIQKSESTYNNYATHSGTFIILPSVATIIRLEVITRDAIGDYGWVTAATVSAWAD